MRRCWRTLIAAVPGYYHWLEIDACIPATEQAAPTPLPTPSRARVWRRFSAWFGDWNIAVPVAASAVLIFAVILWWPLSPKLNAEIDLAYAQLSVQPSARLERTPSPPLPWEGVALGFSESQASIPRRAFGAGLWAGKRALFGVDEETLPEFLSAAEGRTWPETTWADYYALGRWLMLVWALAISDQGIGDWHEQPAIGQRLLSELSKRGGGQEEEARRATAVLQRLKSCNAGITRAAPRPGTRSQRALRKAVCSARTGLP